MIQTQVSTTLGDLLSGAPVRAKPCDAVPALRLPPGEHRVLARSSDTLAVDTVTLTRFGRQVKEAAGEREPVELTRWDAEHRVVEVAERDEPTLLVVPENTNPGWTARLDGEDLEAVTVDGWQQGYVLPAGPAGTVRLDFPPGADYRTVLAGGAGAVLLLLLVAVLPSRPVPAGPRRRRLLGGGDPAVLAGAALVVAVLLGATLVGGLFGLAAVAGLWLVGQCSGRWAPAVLGTVAAGALLAAGAMLLADPDGTETGRQVASLLALAAVGAAVLPLWRRRSAGAAAPGVSG